MLAVTGEGELFFRALRVLRAGESAAGDFLALRVLRAGESDAATGTGDRGDFLALRVLRAGESAVAGDFLPPLRVFRAGESTTSDRAAGSGEEETFSFKTPGGSMEWRILG